MLAEDKGVGLGMEEEAYHAFAHHCWWEFSHIGQINGGSARSIRQMFMWNRNKAMLLSVE